MNNLLDFFRIGLPALLILGGSLGSIILFIKGSIMYALTLLVIAVVSTLFLSAFKYYKDIKFWPESISLGWLWSIFKKNTTRVDIPISAFKNLVGSGAPDVYMNGTTPENSTAFLYRSISGKSYLSRDTNFEKNGGAFYEIISSDNTGCKISNSKQTNILYTDLKNGGFFEYPSSDPKHAGMEIMLNTPTVEPFVTQYASRTSNAKNNFPQGLNYGVNSNFSFVNITKNWLTGDGFEFDKFAFMAELMSGSSLLDVTFILNSTGFRNKWIAAKWNSPGVSYLLMMNTATATSATKYLLIDTFKGSSYISNDALNYNEIDPMTGQSMDNSFIYDYKTGVPPNL